MSDVKPDIRERPKDFSRENWERGGVGGGASRESRAVLKPRQGLIIRNLSSLKKNTAKQKQQIYKYNPFFSV